MASRPPQIWTKCKDLAGRTYYVNGQTHEKSWKKPEICLEASGAVTPPMSSAATATVMNNRMAHINALVAQRGAQITAKGTYTGKILLANMLWLTGMREAKQLSSHKRGKPSSEALDGPVPPPEATAGGGDGAAAPSTVPPSPTASVGDSSSVTSSPAADPFTVLGRLFAALVLAREDLASAPLPIDPRLPQGRSEVRRVLRELVRDARARAQSSSPPQSSANRLNPTSKPGGGGRRRAPTGTGANAALALGARAPPVDGRSAGRGGGGPSGTGPNDRALGTLPTTAAVPGAGAPPPPLPALLRRVRENRASRSEVLVEIFAATVLEWDLCRQAVRLGLLPEAPGTRPPSNAPPSPGAAAADPDPRAAGGAPPDDAASDADWSDDVEDEPRPPSPRSPLANKGAGASDPLAEAIMMNHRAHALLSCPMFARKHDLAVGSDKQHGCTVGAALVANRFALASMLSRRLQASTAAPGRADVADASIRRLLGAARQIAAVDPGSAFGFEAAGMSHAQTGSWPRAAESFLKAANLSERDSPRRAMCLYDVGGAVARGHAGGVCALGKIRKLHAMAHEAEKAQRELHGPIRDHDARALLRRIVASHKGVDDSETVRIGLFDVVGSFRDRARGAGQFGGKDGWRLHVVRPLSPRGKQLQAEAHALAQQNLRKNRRAYGALQKGGTSQAAAKTQVDEASVREDRQQRMAAFLQQQQQQQQKVEDGGTASTRVETLRSGEAGPTTAADGLFAGLQVSR